jgi:coproporphyrinogen III oxidase-like Fe-S oxidoreductase
LKRTPYQFSFGGHPHNTTVHYWQAHHDVGFIRVSFGVRDIDFKVQKATNRLQTQENLERVFYNLCERVSHSEALPSLSGDVKRNKFFNKYLFWC